MITSTITADRSPLRTIGLQLKGWICLPPSTPIPFNLLFRQKAAVSLLRLHIASGGKNGIFNLYEQMKKLSEEGEGESVEYKRIQDLYNKKMSARLNFELKEFALKTEIPFKKYEASELTDSFAKQGIEIGNQVNVEDLQQQQINVLQRIRDMLQDIVTSTNKRGVESYQNEAMAYRFNLNT